MAADIARTAGEANAVCWLSIVGIGEDGLAGLSVDARQALSAAVLVVGGARHLALADELIRGERLAWPSPLQDAFPAVLKRRGQPVVVLASGDPFHYGVGGQVAALVRAGEWRCLPQPSAFALAAARLGWLQQDVALVSLHGRSLGRILPHLAGGARIFALSWDGRTPKRVADLLVERGFGESRLTVLEALGGPRERVRTTIARGFELDGIEALNTIAIEVVAEPDARVLALTPGRPDSLFENDGQLTKQVIRAVTLASLSPRPGELLWDIGLGAGSVAIEWLLAHPSLRAIGIEARPDRAERAHRNAEALGAVALEVVVGRAPDALVGLASPDAVFVGGGMAAAVFDIAWERLRSGGRLVANAVTLETEALLLDLYARHGGELIRLETARAEAVGPRHGWRPAMPILHWKVVKP